MRTQGSAPATSGIIRRFNRDTVWLATGLLGTLIFAAVMVAVQECQRKATEAERDLLLNANPATVAGVVANTSNADGKMTPGPGSSVDHAFTETPPQEILASTPEVNRNDPHTNPDAELLARRQDSAQAIGPKARNPSNRSTVAFRYVGVKRRLIELWHESLARSEKSRSWTAFSNLTSGAKKKAAYTAEKNH